MVMLSRSQEAELPRKERNPPFPLALREGPASSVAVELSRPPVQRKDSVPSSVLGAV